MTADPDVLRRLAAESGERLGELGVRAEDEKWIRVHAETIASLVSRRGRRWLPAAVYRFARRAARMAR